MNSMNKENSTRRTFRQPLSTLGRVTCGALLLNALSYFLYCILVYQVAGFIAFLLLLPVSMLVVAVLVATGLRWTPAIGALAAGAITFATLTRPENPYALTHPSASAAFFSILVLILASAAVAILAGIWATVQNNRTAARTALPGLRTGLVGLGGLVVGMILISFIVAASPQGGSTTSSTNGEPTVHMGVGSFSQNLALVPKGEKLKLVDDGPFQHILENGRWNANGIPTTEREPGAPVVSNLDVTAGSIEIGPFTTAGVYHLYCTIHKGMNLTILVE